MSYGGTSGGSSRISTAADAALSNPASGDVLGFDASLQKWKNIPLPTQGSSGGSSAGWANVKDYGAIGNGTVDDSAAFASAVASGKAVYLPPGNYKIITAGFDTYRPRIFGSSKWDVTITLSPDIYFYDVSTFINQVFIQGITFSGGAGAFRQKYTSANVSDIHTVADCSFLDYTVCAISNNAADMPLWKVERNFFRGANDTTTIGVALTGLTDTHQISDNEFFSNAVHIKLGNGGNNAYVKHNDFIQGNSYNNAMRTMLWIVPRAGSTINAGSGLVAWDNKWGNENLGVADKRVLYADEGNGSYFGSRLPDIITPSTGYVIGNMIGGGAVNGSSENPLVFATTPNIRGCHFGKDMIISGGQPSMILQTLSPAAAPDPEAFTNLVGPMIPADGYWKPQPVTNSPALITAVIDPNGFFETAQNSLLSHYGGSAPAGFVNLLSTRTTAINSGGATLTATTDALGGVEAVEFSTDAGAPYVYLSSQIKPGVPVWIEFDVMAGSSNSLTVLELMFGLDSAYSGGPGNYLRRNIAVSSSWQTHRLRTVPATGGANVLLKFRASSLGTGTGVKIGRIRAYHAREPIMQELSLPMATTTTSSPVTGAAAALPSAPTGYVTVMINGSARKIAYY